MQIHTGWHRRRGAFSTPLPLCLFAFLPSHLALCSARPVLWPFMLQHCGSQTAVPGAAVAENPLEMQRTPQIRRRAGPGLLSSLALPAVAGGRPGLRATTLPDRKLWAVPAWPGFNPPKDNMTLFTSPGADGISQMVTRVSAGRGEAGSLGPCCVGNGLGAPQTVKLSWGPTQQFPSSTPTRGANVPTRTRARPCSEQRPPRPDLGVPPSREGCSSDPRRSAAGR